MTTRIHPLHSELLQPVPSPNIISRRVKDPNNNRTNRCHWFAFGALVGSLIVLTPLGIVVTLWQVQKNVATTTSCQTDTTTMNANGAAMSGGTATPITSIINSSSSSISTITNTATLMSTTTGVPTSTTTPNPCTNSNATGSNYLSPGTPLFSTYTVPTQCTPYFETAWLYIAQSATETLTISIYNNPATTDLDDISILDMNTSQELLDNGGFENGTTSWSGTALSYIGQFGGCRTGSWCYNDASVNTNHSISQTVTTTIGHTLLVSFYIEWTGSGAGVYNYITITP